jgi:hypothetical protein
VPHCSALTRGAALDDRTNFPYLLRMRAWESTSGRAAVDFAMRNTWINAAVLYDGSDYCVQWYLVGLLSLLLVCFLSAFFHGLLYPGTLAGQV